MLFTYQVFHTLGVEAARIIISEEITYIMKAYGISIDRRHLLLLADVMTFKVPIRKGSFRLLYTCTIVVVSAGIMMPVLFRFALELTRYNGRRFRSEWSVISCHPRIFKRE